jgi:hypothetical protein
MHGLKIELAKKLCSNRESERQEKFASGIFWDTFIYVDLEKSHFSGALIIRFRSTDVAKTPIKGGKKPFMFAIVCGWEI